MAMEDYFGYLTEVYDNFFNDDVAVEACIFSPYPEWQNLVHPPELAQDLRFGCKNG